MQKTAQIICHRAELLPGRFAYSYEWGGPRSWPVEIDYPSLREMLGREEVPKDQVWPDEISGVLPWKLRLVGEHVNFAYNSAIYVRADSGSWLFWKAEEVARRCQRWLMFRLIFTLMVWGLAYVEPGEITSWQCIGRKRKRN